MNNKNVLIAGGSGFIGTQLEEFLRRQGYSVSILSRNLHEKSDRKAFVWDTKSQIIDPEAIQWADIIINLAGQGIADKRWTKKRKNELILSRTNSVQTLIRVIKQDEHSINHFIQASAIGYYGMENQKISNESHPSGTDFLATICNLLEKELLSIEDTAKMKFSIARIGTVLDASNGFLSKLLPLFKMGFPHHFGSGKQFLSWIHIHDLCRSILHIIEKDKGTTYNLTSPYPIEFKEFSHKLNKTIRNKMRSFYVPEFPLRLILGELSKVVLNGVEVYPAELKKTGFEFRFSHIEEALFDLLS